LKREASLFIRRREIIKVSKGTVENDGRKL
jgi:hypothetical protein